MKPWYQKERDRLLHPHETKAWAAAVCEWCGRKVPITAQTTKEIARFGRYIIPKDRDLLWGLYIKHLLLRSE